MKTYHLTLKVSHPEGEEVYHFELKERQRLFIGRKEGDVIVPDRMVSRKHLGLAPVKGRLIVADLSSTYGTRLEGAPISQTSIKTGQSLSLGKKSVITVEEFGRLRNLPDLPSLGRLPKLPSMGSISLRSLNEVSLPSRVGAVLFALAVAGVLTYSSGPSDRKQTAFKRHSQVYTTASGVSISF